MKKQQEEKDCDSEEWKQCEELEHFPFGISGPESETRVIGCTCRLWCCVMIPPKEKEPDSSQSYALKR